MEKHQRHFDAIVERFRPLFIEEADVKAIMQSIFNTLLDFAVRMYNGVLENNEINTPHIFNVLYCMMVTYLKNAEKIGSNTQLI